MTAIHASVLLREVVSALSGKTRLLDLTLGLGGHSEALLEAASPETRLLGIDRDPMAIELARGRLERFSTQIELVEGSFSEAETYLELADMLPVDGVIADLGVSSLQLDRAERGFSFMREGPLDMRMGPSVGPSAAQWLEGFDASRLARVLRDFGEVRKSYDIAQAIIEARDAGKLETTTELAEVIARAQGGRKATPIHPATRAFQAIRIAVNRELEEIEALLSVLPRLVAPGGVVAIISFHSLEDRLVKRAFSDPKPAYQPRLLPVEPVLQKGPWEPVHKGVITPSAEELATNPRSRSAKLRVVARRNEVSDGI